MLLTSVWTLTALLPARPTLRAQCAHRSIAAFMSSTEGMACGGGHVVMDYEDFFVDAAPAGEWMLEALRGAVADARVREVHHKLVVLGERGESPPGFTAAVLIDESHVTAHCYSTRGWLALDVFTCGSHDPRALADDIHARIAEYAPRARRVQSRYVPRFLHAAPVATDNSDGGRDGSGDSSDSATDPAATTHTPLRSSAERARAGALTMSEGTGSASESGPSGSGASEAVGTGATADDSDSDAGQQQQAELLAAYRQRMDAEGGEALFRAKGDVSTALSDAAALREGVVRGAVDTLDLDGVKAARGAGRRGPDAADVATWRVTVAALLSVVLLSGWAALTTDFGPDDTEFSRAELAAAQQRAEAAAGTAAVAIGAGAADGDLDELPRGMRAPVE